LYTGDNVEIKNSHLGASKLVIGGRIQVYWTDIDFEYGVKKRGKTRITLYLKRSFFFSEDICFFKPYSIEYLFFGKLM